MYFECDKSDAKPNSNLSKTWHQAHNKMGTFILNSFDLVSLPKGTASPNILGF